MEEFSISTNHNNGDGHSYGSKHQFTSSSEAIPTSLTFEHVSYAVSGKDILRDISGYVPAGSFAAILGPSGAGKSSLLDLLASRKKRGNISGEILYNGVQFNDEIKERAAYVQQEDTLLSNLTVRESLSFSLDLRVSPSRMTSAERKARVGSVIDALNLSRVADSKVGNPLKRGLSGGERRRLSIGMELVTSPSLVFCDEPTSGLDSHNAVRVVKCLKHLCQEKGVTTICTLHQPRSNVFQMFDYLLLLCEGQVVYFGPGEHSLDYFENTLGLVCPPHLNPADFFLDMIAGGDDDQEDDATHSVVPNSTFEVSSPLLEANRKVSINDNQTCKSHEESVHRLVASFSTSSAAQQAADHIIEMNQHHSGVFQRFSEQTHSTLDVPQRKPSFLASLVEDVMAETEAQPRVSVWTQISVLTRRTWLDTVRDPMVMYVRTGAAVVVSLLIGFMFFQEPDDKSSESPRLNSILFLMCCFSLIMLPSISRFIEERALYTREYASGFYTPLAYMLSHFVCEFPLLLMTVVAYGAIAYWMIGFYPAFGNFAFFLMGVTIVILDGYGVSQLISAFSSSTNMAIALYIVFFLYSLLMGGFIIPKDAFPDGFTWLLWTSYFYPGFVALVINEFHDRSWGQSVLEDMDIQGMNEWYCMILLAIIYVVAQILEYLTLRFWLRERK